MLGLDDGPNSQNGQKKRKWPHHLVSGHRAPEQLKLQYDEESSAIPPKKQSNHHSSTVKEPSPAKASKAKNNTKV